MFYICIELICRDSFQRSPFYFHGSNRTRFKSMQSAACETVTLHASFSFMYACMSSPVRLCLCACVCVCTSADMLTETCSKRAACNVEASAAAAATKRTAFKIFQSRVASHRAASSLRLTDIAAKIYGKFTAPDICCGLINCLCVGQGACSV